MALAKLNELRFSSCTLKLRFLLLLFFFPWTAPDFSPTFSKCLDYHYFSPSMLSFIFSVLPLEIYLNYLHCSCLPESCCMFYLLWGEGQLFFDMTSKTGMHVIQTSLLYPKKNDISCSCCYIPLFCCFLGRFSYFFPRSLIVLMNCIK